MHQLDRTQLEYAMQELQPEAFEFSGEGREVYGEAGAEGTFQETGLFETGMQEAPYETGLPEVGGYEVLLPENQEMELAAELLEVTNEQELDHFLGGLIRSVGRTLGQVVRSPIGRALGGILKPLAKAALPIAGTALGTFVGGPAGGLVGGKLASMAGQLFGLELEGLSPEDREFEVARRFVRFASDATRRTLAASPTANPQALARAAVSAASRQLAPGLVGGPAPAPLTMPPAGIPAERISAGARRRGTWIRRGSRIVLIGIF
jgi:hypothetical protein